MSEEPLDHRITSIDIPGPEGVHIAQTSTRGEGIVEVGEAFGRDTIDFSGALDHLTIHTDGAVAGSQFNGELFASPQDVVDRVTAVLPEELHYDQHGRAELTITAEGTILGYSGVKPVGELEQTEGVSIMQGMRTPGGEPAEVDGVKGAWFPEMLRDTDTGRFEVATNPDGSVKNPHGKFEPEALIAHVEEDTLPQALATDKLTTIIQKNPETGVPTVLTIFPGENAPAFPTKIESEAFQVDTLQGGPEAAYWSNHAFVMLTESGVDTAPETTNEADQVRARGEGYTVYDQVIDPETIQTLATEAKAVGEAAVISGWQHDPEYDTDSLKSRYRIVNFLGRTSGIPSEQLKELCPTTLEQLHALEERVGMKVKNAQFNFYEPHSWIRPHRDAYGSAPYAVASVGVSGEGTFAVMPDEQDTEGQTEEFTLKPGEVALLEPIDQHGSYTTRVHAARNDSDQPRTVLVVTFEGEY